MAEKPRVFHLITRLLKGGAEAKTIETVLGLEDYEFVVGHGAEYDPEQVLRLEKEGVKTHRLKSIRHYNPVTAVIGVGAVARYLEKHDFDIVHTHSTEAGIIGRFAASIANVPIVIHTVHGVPFASDRNDILNRFVLYCERAAARRTDCLITNADAIAEEYLTRDIGRENQYRTVYSGIHLDDFHQATPAEDVSGDGIRIVMVGRLADGKGFEDLITAVEQLPRDKISVYFVGDGPLKDQLQKEIDERGLSDTIHLLGYRTDIPEILAACDIFVLPSYREGTPRVITEAMASGLPVVATNIAGVPEQIEDGVNGILIEPGDVNTLVAGLQQLIESPELRQQYAASSRERVERFSIQQMLTDIDSIYQDLLTNH